MYKYDEWQWHDKHTDPTNFDSSIVGVKLENLAQVYSIKSQNWYLAILFATKIVSVQMLHVGLIMKSKAPVNNAGYSRAPGTYVFRNKPGQQGS